MSGITDIHTEILNDAQINLLHDLSEALMNSDCYLAGGTALALKLGHRLSKVFDWFINRLGDPEVLFRRLRSTLELFIKKYKNSDIGHVIRSLVYLKHAEAEPELNIIAPFDWVKMKADFEGWVKKNYLLISSS
jgi:hypothetical protein